MRSRLKAPVIAIGTQILQTARIDTTPWISAKLVPSAGTYVWA
ncbi:hypothetical protein [Streptomyces inhibens]|nr:hypothetical protein [Streptomyces inhibens]